MDTVLDWSLVTGPLPVVLLLAGGVALLALGAVRGDRRWWTRTVPLVVLMTSAVVGATALAVTLAYLSWPRAQLPVLVLLGGQPGEPRSWLDGGRLAAMLASSSLIRIGTLYVRSTRGWLMIPVCRSCRPAWAMTTDGGRSAAADGEAASICRLLTLRGASAHRPTSSVTQDGATCGAAVAVRGVIMSNVLTRLCHRAGRDRRRGRGSGPAVVITVRAASDAGRSGANVLVGTGAGVCLSPWRVNWVRCPLITLYLLWM